MWLGFEWELARYGFAIIKEWKSRGFMDTCNDKIVALLNVHTPSRFIPNTGTPFWLGNEDFHLSHRSNLVRKNAAHYRRYFPDVPDNLPYVWPV